MDTQDKTIRKYQKIFNDVLATSHLYKYKEPVILDPELEEIEPLSKRSKIFILNEDMLDTAYEIFKQGVIPLLVYPVDNIGVYNKAEVGSTTYECDLYRRTNIAAVKKKIFPLNDRIVLYPGLTVFKSSMYEPCEPFTIAVLMMTPVITPSIVSIVDNSNIQVEYQNPTDYKKMDTLIHCIFNIALDYEYKCVITRDFGCDAGIDNPIGKVCDMFNSAIAKYNVPLVIFCIQPPVYAKNTTKKYKNHIYFHENIIR